MEENGDRPEPATRGRFFRQPWGKRVTDERRDAMSMTPQTLADHRLAFIQARWHAEIVDQARIGLLEALPPGLQVDVIAYAHKMIIK